jgi:hypothetical protein
MKKYFMKIGADDGESIPMSANGLGFNHIGDQTPEGYHYSTAI